MTLLAAAFKKDTGYTIQDTSKDRRHRERPRGEDAAR